tara:strand:+ start:106 stop:375 length:270 start_codon:yes stop_codon:yes gene_type:complete
MVDFSKTQQNKYFPKRTPSEYSQGYIQDELGYISSAIEQQALGFIDVSNVAPEKPRQGMIRYADGSNWNPNSTGEGIYFYNSAGAWVKL